MKIFDQRHFERCLDHKKLESKIFNQSYFIKDFDQSFDSANLDNSWNVTFKYFYKNCEHIKL